MNLPNKVLVVGTPRSGTTFFAKIFENTLGYRYYYELTHRNWLIDNDGPRYLDEPASKSAHEYLFSKNIQNFTKSKEKCVAKALSTHLIEYRATLDYIEKYRNDIDLIIYCRRPVVDSLISLNDAIETDVWNANKESIYNLANQIKNIDFVLDNQTIIDYYNKTKKFDEYFSNLVCENLYIADYSENLRKSHYIFLRNLGTGSVNSALPSKLKKLKPYYHKYSVIYNINEARAHIEKVIEENS